MLVIQPLALGDLLFLTPLWAGLRAARPGSEITLLADQAHQEALAPHPDLDRFLPFPRRELFRLANQPGPAPLAAGLELLSLLAAALPRGWDLVYAPAYNDLAAGLTRLAAPTAAPTAAPGGAEGKVLGADFTPEGYLVMRGDWPTYLHLTFDEPSLNSLHLADLHCLAAGVRPPEPGLRLYLSPSERRAGAELLGSLGAREGDSLVALHPGATRPAKRWPPASFLALGRLLREEGHRPVLVGLERERELTAPLAQALPGALDATGKTTVRALAALLAHCRALAGNDSGPIHLAAAVGTPTLSLTLGKVQFRATGPQLPGSLALEADLPCAPCADPADCPDWRCHLAITPADALAGLRHLMGAPLAPPADGRARYHQAFRDAAGRLDWRDLHRGRDGKAVAAWRSAWLASLAPGADWPRANGPEPPAPAAEPWRSGDLLLGRGLALLARLGKAAAGARGPLAHELGGVSRGLRELGIREPLLKPLAIYFTHRLASLDAPDLAGQLAGQTGLHQQARRALRLAALAFAGEAPC